MKLSMLREDIFFHVEAKGSITGHKIINKMEKVWQPIDYKRVSKSRSWMTNRKIYAATTSIDKPYASQGL
jgi:hypothetical protein